MGAHRLATGHNADDVAETVLLNLLRGDAPRCGWVGGGLVGEEGGGKGKENGAAQRAARGRAQVGGVWGRGVMRLVGVGVVGG